MLLLSALACVADPAKSTGAASGDTASTPPARVEDRFHVTAPAEADVLLVVDTAAGTEDLRTAFASELPALVDAMLGAGGSYRLGVVSADPGDPTLREVAGEAWAEIPTGGADLGALLAGAGPAGRASPTLAIVAATTEAGNAPFFRAGADLHAVVVGSGSDDATAAELPPEGFDAWLQAGHPGARLHCVVPAGADPACSDRAAASGGRVVEPGGLDALGVAIVDLPVSFALTRWPVEDTLAVTVTDDEAGVELAFDADVDWTWDPVTNVVTFLAYVPSAGAEVHVGYEPAG